MGDLRIEFKVRRVDRYFFRDLSPTIDWSWGALRLIRRYRMVQKKKTCLARTWTMKWKNVKLVVRVGCPQSKRKRKWVLKIYHPENFIRTQIRDRSKLILIRTSLGQVPKMETQSIRLNTREGKGSELCWFGTVGFSPDSSGTEPSRTDIPNDFRLTRWIELNRFGALTIRQQPKSCHALNKAQ